MDGMDVFIYSLVCISSLIKFIKQDDKYIYKFKCKKCQERREVKLSYMIPFGFLHRLYRVFFTSILINCT